jgi:UDP-N-acetylmuramoyl-L-alanyl-D-glutamate--2,6-diaminopimelate ligase
VKIALNSSKFKFISDDSRDIGDNCAFLASTQTKQYQDEAIKNGALEIIESKELKNYIDISGIKVIGVTGTNGKTTTTAAIYSLLIDLGYSVALQGTRGFYIDDEKIANYGYTTAPLLLTYYQIALAKSKGCEFFIMEVSSHAISQGRVEEVEFALKVHTNITQDHLDYHQTLDEYIRVKNSFFSDESMKLINKDDKNIEFNYKNSYTYSLENASSFKVHAYSLNSGISAVVQHFDEVENFYSQLFGIFNIYNLTAAIASVKLLTKKPLKDICNEVENFAGVLGRMEIVSNSPLIIVDFAHTPDGMRKVFESFQGYSINVVFGAGGDRDRDKRAKMGQVASEFAKKIFITSDNPRFEDPDQIVNDILKGIKDKSNVKVELNRKEAIKMAIDSLDDSDILLILGKGDEEYQIIYDKKLPFNDKKVIKEILDIND